MLLLLLALYLCMMYALSVYFYLVFDVSELPLYSLPNERYNFQICGVFLFPLSFKIIENLQKGARIT